MPRSRELRGVVVPDVDNNALRRNVTGPLNRALESVSSIAPSLDVGGLGAGGGQRGGGGGLGRQGIQVAQLETLEDIHDTLREQDGGGGLLGGGLAGLLGRVAGGGLLAGGIGTGGVLAALGGTGIGGGLLASEFLKKPFENFVEKRGGTPGQVASERLGLGRTVGDTIEKIRNLSLPEFELPDIVSAANSAVDAFSSGIDSALEGFRSLQLPQSIRGFSWPTFQAPDLSGLTLPGPIQDFVGLFGGGGGDGGRGASVSPTAEDMGLAPSDQRLVNMQSRRARPQQSRPQANIDLSPNIDIGVNLDPAGLEDLRRQLKRDLQNDQGLIDEIVDLATSQVEAKITGIGQFG